MSVVPMYILNTAQMSKTMETAMKDYYYIYVVAKRACQGKADPIKALELILEKVKQKTSR